MNPLEPERIEEITEEHKRYWRVNKSIILALLVVWFIVSYLLGIVFVEPLNNIRLGGFPLGFWIAQQGSIYVFIVLILIYCLFMEREDRKYHVAEDRRRKERDK